MQERESSGNRYYDLDQHNIMVFFFFFFFFLIIGRHFVLQPLYCIK